jgi:thiol-disulfide isomerase/thioredoxin
MRTEVLFIIFFLIVTKPIQSQTASVSGIIKNGNGKTINFYRPSKSLRLDYFKQGFKEIKVARNGSFKLAMPVGEPEIIFVSIYDDSLEKILFRYNLFLSPGDNLTLLFDLNEPVSSVAVSGKGANNNQPLEIFEEPDSTRRFYKDTLPDNIYNYVRRISERHRQVLRKYISRYKPSAAFIKAWEYELAYEPADIYYGFEHNNAFGIRKEYERNREKWIDKRQEMLAKISFSNDAALVSPHYQAFIKTYLLRTKESLWKLSIENRSVFLQEWYANDTVSGWSDFRKDMENQLLQKIIEKYFTGKTKEFLYAILLEDAIAENTITNLIRIYGDFKKQYPGSNYRKLFDRPIQKIAKQLALPLTDKMVFISKPDTITTWEQVLQQVRGKTVLLDMWGTWCAPCRREIYDNSDSIKAYFKGKGLEYLYIANYDRENEDKWKELIAFFRLEGIHLLAEEKLTRDIMEKIKGTGYPTYIVIDKHGHAELSRAGYPMDRNLLIRQLEEALK